MISQELIIELHMISNVVASGLTLALSEKHIAVDSPAPIFLSAF